MTPAPPENQYREDSGAPDPMLRPAPSLALAVALAGVLLVALAWGVATWGRQNSRAVTDETRYHLPTIEAFADQLPAPDLTDYRSATTPGYHLVLSVLDRADFDHNALRTAGSLFGIALVLTVAMCAHRQRYQGGLISVALPLAASVYVVTSARWLLPDNAGWLGVALLLGLALGRGRSVWRLALAGAVLVALVSVRQVHLWAAAVVWTGAFFATDRAPWPQRPDLPPLGERVRYALASVVATAPAFVVVAAFGVAWEGLVPPMFQPGVIDPVTGLQTPPNTGFSLAIPQLTLALLGPFSLFFVGFAYRAHEAGRWTWMRAVRWALIGAVAGVVIAALGASTHDQSAGRFGAIWAIAGRFPAVADRSILIVALAGLGGAAVGFWALALPRRSGLILASALVAFMTAHAFTGLAFQRYAEPFVLVVLALAAGETAGRFPAPKWAPIGPLVLATGLAVVTALSLTQTPSS